MLKGKKIALVIVEMIIICLTFGCISSYATEPQVIPIKNSVSTNSNNKSKTDDNTSNENKSKENNTNIETISTKTKNTSNTSNYANTNKNATNKSELPYAGSDSSIVFVGLALAASAVYAYKKITDYKNV